MRSGFFNRIHNIAALARLSHLSTTSSIEDISAFPNYEALTRYRQLLIPVAHNHPCQIGVIRLIKRLSDIDEPWHVVQLKGDKQHYCV